MYFQLLDEVSVESVEAKISIAQKWLQHAYDWFIAFFPNIIYAVIIFILGWWLTKIIRKIFVNTMKKSKADQTVISFLSQIINVSLKTLIILCVLSTIGFDVTTLITAIGAAAVTIGLALKDSLANVASGTLIIINKKFKTGDYLETEGLQGEVVKIEMMYTTLRTYDNKEIMIPNSRLTSNNITNYFVRSERRVEFTVPIKYDEDIESVKDLILKTIYRDKRVLKENSNKVFVKTFNESSVDLTVWIWCKSQDYWDVLADMQEEIKNTLDQNNISIPFNQLDVHIIENK